MSSGKRYSKEEKEEIMHYRQNHTYRETADKYKVSQMSLARWSQKFKNKVVTGDRFTGDPVYKVPLQALKYIEGVKAIGVFSDNTDGSSVASLTDDNISEDVLFLAMITSLSATVRSTESLDLGTFNLLISRHSKGFLVIPGISQTLIMIIIYGENTDINKIIKDLPYIERVGQDISKRYEKSD